MCVEELGGYDMSEDNTIACERVLTKLRKLTPEGDWQTLGGVVESDAYSQYDKAVVYVRKDGV